MSIRLILDPFDSGHRGQRMGMGPLAMAENGLAHRLAKVAGPVHTSMIEFDTDFVIEMATTFAVLREIAREAREARQAGEFAGRATGQYFQAEMMFEIFFRALLMRPVWYATPDPVGARDARISRIWYRGEDLNLHGVAPTST